MPLTPLEIHNKEFRKGFRGYLETEVDEFLDQVVRDYEALVKENAILKEQLDALSSKLEHYRRLEETLQNTLVIAQETAEEVKSSARKEAELIVREARLEVERTVKVGEERVREVRETIDQLQKQAQVFRAKIRGMLESHMEILEADWGLGERVSAAGAVAAAESGREPAD